jgi:DNA primase
MIKQLTSEFESYRDTDPEKYFDSIKKIMMLNELSRRITEKLGWSPVTKSPIKF